jgi:glycosyltransferase involved in cell wall biosynthesis
VEPLLEDGHTVHLVGMRIPQTYPPDAKPEIVIQRERLTYASVIGELYFGSPYVRRVYEQLAPEAVIYAHASVSYDGTLLDHTVPVWIDLCGHVIAEAQAKAAVYHDDSYVEYFFRKIVGSLFCGDRFSTVSDAQRYALIGELGLAGRLNSRTNGHDLVFTIPCGAEELDYRHEKIVLRGVDVGEDAFVVLWSGGFNTWTDVDTMFEGLCYAMDRNRSVYFVPLAARSTATTDLPALRGDGAQLHSSRALHPQGLAAARRGRQLLLRGQRRHQLREGHLRGAPRQQAPHPRLVAGLPSRRHHASH